MRAYMKKAESDRSRLQDRRNRNPASAHRSRSSTRASSPNTSAAVVVSHVAPQRREKKRYRPALAAFEGDATELWTHDAAFSTMPGLRLVDPLT
jgi:hypothetical protein